MRSDYLGRRELNWATTILWAKPYSTILGFSRSLKIQTHPNRLPARGSYPPGDSRRCRPDGATAALLRKTSPGRDRLSKTQGESFGQLICNCQACPTPGPKLTPFCSQRLPADTVKEAAFRARPVQ